jgi:hypothetical protein
VASVSEDLIAQYLAELRARLRTPPERTTDMLAEAEDHLREPMAAGLAAGMSEQEAQQAAISAFGSVRTVARANCHPAGVLTPLGLAASKAAGVYLLTVSAASFAMYLWMGAVISGLGSPAVWAGCGAAGLTLLDAIPGRPRSVTRTQPPTSASSREVPSAVRRTRSSFRPGSRNCLPSSPARCAVTSRRSPS